MTFSETQLETLAAWEDNFRTAVNAQWARNPGTSALRAIWDIYTSATGDRRRFNDNCSHCILSLLTDCGKAYFKDKAERRAVAVSESPVDAVPKVTIKTRKKKAK